MLAPPRGPSLRGGPDLPPGGRSDPRGGLLNTPWKSGRDLDGFRRKERVAHRESGDALPLAGILGDYLRRSSLGEALLPGSSDFLAAWKDAAGPFAARCEPARWKDGVLWVRIPDPGWKFELRWKVASIAQALRDRGVPVREIRILP